MIVILGQNNSKDSGISYVRGIAKWWGRTAASQRRRNGSGSPRHWGKSSGKGKLQLPSAFIVGGGREGATVVSHVGNKTPAACRSGSTTMRAGFPYPKSLMGGLRSAFEPVARVGKVFGLHCSRAQAC
jgi:hypothetical protein